MFRDFILKKIICNDELSENSLAIYECLKELITILILIVRSHLLDFNIKLSFDFDLSDELLLLICFYTQKSLFSEANIESFSALCVIDHVEASMMKSSVKLLIELPARSSTKSYEK